MLRPFRLLARLLAKILFALLVPAAALWLIPRFVSIDRPREKLLERLNRSIPGRLAVEHARIELIPHPGVQARGLALHSRTTAGPLLPLAAAPYGEFRLDLRSLPDDEKRVRLHLPSVEIRLRAVGAGSNLSPFLGKEPRVSAPAPERGAREEPSALERKIEERSRQLARGQFGRPGPAAAPTPSATRLPSWVPVQPTPIPEKPSVLEKVRFEGLSAGRAEIRLKGPWGEVLAVAAPLVLDAKPGRWPVRARLAPGAVTAVAELLAACEGNLRPLSRQEAELEIGARSVRLVRWPVSESGRSWTGEVSWSGEAELTNGAKRAWGKLGKLSCGNR